MLCLRALVDSDSVCSLRQSGYLAVRTLVKLHQLFTKHPQLLLDSIQHLTESFKNAGDVENNVEQYFTQQLPLRMVSELVEEHKPPLPPEERGVILEVDNRKRVAAIGTYVVVCSVQCIVARRVSLPSNCLSRSLVSLPPPLPPTVQVKGSKATTKEQLRDSLQWMNLKRYARHRAAVAAGDRRVPNLPYEKPNFEKLMLCAFDGKGLC